MNTSLFCKALFTSGLTVMLSLVMDSAFYKAIAKEPNDYPLLSMKIYLVSEKTACAPSGYGNDCNTLFFDNFNNLVTKFNVKPLAEVNDIPSGRKIFLAKELGAALKAYSSYKRTENFLPFNKRKSVVAVFDLKKNRTSNFWVSIRWDQPAGQQCGDGVILKRDTYSYETTLPSENQYFLYHTPAEVFDSCANVNWTLTITDTETNKQYAPWTFSTTSQEN